LARSLMLPVTNPSFTVAATTMAGDGAAADTDIVSAASSDTDTEASVFAMVVSVASVGVVRDCELTGTGAAGSTDDDDDNHENAAREDAARVWPGFAVTDVGDITAGKPSASRLIAKIPSTEEVERCNVVFLIRRAASCAAAETYQRSQDTHTHSHTHKTR
jgi:hypothetical protein